MGFSIHQGYVKLIKIDSEDIYNSIIIIIKFQIQQTYLKKWWKKYSSSIIFSNIDNKKKYFLQYIRMISTKDRVMAAENSALASQEYITFENGFT